MAESETIPRATQEERALSKHRRARMRELGFSIAEGELIYGALLPEGRDWHYVHALLANGCSLELAKQILI